jgi:hypothetical protein
MVAEMEVRKLTTLGPVAMVQDPYPFWNWVNEELVKNSMNVLLLASIPNYSVTSPGCCARRPNPTRRI